MENPPTQPTQPTQQPTPTTPTAVTVTELPAGNVEAAPQPVAPAPSSTAAYSYSDLSKRRGSKRAKILMITWIVGVILLAIFSAVYFWALPTSRAKAYKTDIKEPYNQQISKMKSVYQSFNLPVFMSPTTSQASDNQDFAHAQSAINEAKAATKNLADKNQLQLLPGMALLPSAAKAQKQYQTTKNYIANSNAFLANYQTAVTYMEKLEHITYSEYQPLVDSINAIDSAKTIPQYTALVQNADALLSKFTTDLSALQPPIDLKNFNDDLITDFSQLQSGLNGLSQALNAQNLTLLSQSAQQIQDAGARLVALGSRNIQVDLQHHSLLRTQISDLEEVKPLD